MYLTSSKKLEKYYHHLNKKLITATNNLDDSAWKVDLSKN